MKISLKIEKALKYSVAVNSNKKLMQIKFWIPTRP